MMMVVVVVIVDVVVEALRPVNGTWKKIWQKMSFQDVQFDPIQSKDPQEKELDLILKT